MEAVTAGATGAQGTGSKTIADLLPLAVKKYGDKPAQRHKAGDEWVEASYNELGEVVKEVALGLVDLGIQPGDKVSILAHTRPEWTHACFGILTAGGTLVTIYQTNSPEECQYVLEHSDSRAIFVEDAEQLAKVREVEDRCPELEHVIVMDPEGAELGDASRSTRCASAAAAVTSPSGRRATRPSAPTTSASTSTPPARPGRRRAACSRTPTTGRSRTRSWSRARWRTATPPTSSSRSPTPSRS